jgi:hypothetical protein
VATRNFLFIFFALIGFLSKKETTICRRFYVEKTQCENSTKRPFLFFPLYFLIREREKIEREEKGTTVFAVGKLNFQIESSQRKKLESKKLLLQSCFFDFRYKSNKRKKTSNFF